MVILQQFLYKPFLNMMEQRRKRIADAMMDADRASQAAAEAEQEKARILDEARREAQEIRSQAAREAEKIGQEIRSRAEQDAAEIRAKAQADAEAQLQDVMSQAEKQIAELAILAAEQILGRELQNKAEQERFVTEFLAQQSGSAVQ
jgi:F-type H+-transporting ATPase subunit b